MRLRTSCLRWGSGTSGMGSSLKNSLRSEATVGTSCSCSRSTLSPLSHRCLSCLVLTTEPHRRNKPLYWIPVTRKQKVQSVLSVLLCTQRAIERSEWKESRGVTIFIQELHHVSQHKRYSTDHLSIFSQCFQGDPKHTPGSQFRLWNQGGNNGLWAYLSAGPQDSHWIGVILCRERAWLKYRNHIPPALSLWWLPWIVRTSQSTGTGKNVQKNDRNKVARDVHGQRVKCILLGFGTLFVGFQCFVNRKFGVMEVAAAVCQWEILRSLLESYSWTL